MKAGIANNKIFLTSMLFLGILVLTYVVLTVQLGQNKSLQESVDVIAVATSTRVATLEQTKIGEVASSTRIIEVSEDQKAEDLANKLIQISNQKKLNFIEVIDSCDAGYGGTCLSVRSGPGTEYDKVYKLRTGMVLKTSGSTIVGDTRWYKISFDEWLRFPERVKGDWYVSGDFVRVIADPGMIEIPQYSKVETNKKIVVDRSEQTLTAYEGSDVFMEQSISTGLSDTPTPRGTFRIFRKVPSRYMQGPTPGISSQFFDLPGVPFTMYFNEDGAAIHGAYWHNKFGTPWSHGCINVPVDKAEALYDWADLGTVVVVRD
jgi:hypothetical protein